MGRCNLSLSKSKDVSKHFIHLIPQLKERTNAPHYLLEKTANSLYLHRKLGDGETLWYNTQQVMMYDKQLYIKNIQEFSTITQAMDYVKTIWKTVEPAQLNR